MKKVEYIFVINPAAGPSDSTKLVEDAIAQSKNAANCHIYRTEGPGDATDYVAKKCSQCAGPLRFFACGGDGTLNEVINGAVNFPDAGVGVFPCGSGNDFVKYYGGAQGFMNIDDLIEGNEHQIDLIRANGKYCINVFDFGFDTAVLKTMEKVKTHKFLSGNRAYFAGVAKALLSSMKTPCKVTVDGEVICDDYALLCTVANGKYVGSSFQCAPRSKDDDGLLEVCFVKPISRLTFFRLIKFYTRGEHLDNPLFKDLIVYRRARRIEIEGGKNFLYALDGELAEEPCVNVEVVEKAISFIVPRGIGIENIAAASAMK
ncbi:MAG: YegS/Rv2252/BmrU family lipid kinase [Oscillospiraceae bacterium]|nr:YegS/Rv2252/BmrU family lipid kinase [Oscillospiraceae bacterium]